MNLSLPYIAGFVDGEGCIRISALRSNVYPQVLVVNTNLTILKKLQNQFGGDIYPILHRKKNWKPSWSWRISWKRAVQFCECIYPYIQIKKQQIETVLAWRDLHSDFYGKRDQEANQLLVDRMHWLNKRGPNKESDPIDKVLAEVK